MLGHLALPEKDHRRAPRSRISVAARYVSENLTIDSVITDLSPDGVFFSSDYLDAAGELVKVVLDIPWRPRPLELRGEVRWVNDVPRAGGMGIQFLDVSQEDRAVLTSLGLVCPGDSIVSLDRGDPIASLGDQG